MFSFFLHRLINSNLHCRGIWGFFLRWTLRNSTTPRWASEWRRYRQQSPIRKAPKAAVADSSTSPSPIQLRADRCRWELRPWHWRSLSRAVGEEKVNNHRWLARPFKFGLLSRLQPIRQGDSRCAWYRWWETRLRESSLLVSVFASPPQGPTPSHRDSLRSIATRTRADDDEMQHLWSCRFERRC